MPIITKEKEDFIDHLDDCQCQRCAGKNPNLYAKGGFTINGRMIMKRFDGTGGKTYNLIKDDRGEKPYYTLEEEESGKIISEGESYYEVNEISNMFGGNYAKGGKLYTKDELLKKFKGKFIDTYPNYDYTTKETKYEVRSVKSKIHENHETPEEIVYGYAKGGSVSEKDKKRYNIDEYSSHSSRISENEYMERTNDFDELVEKITKRARDKKIPHIEIYYKDSFIGSINDRDNYKFRIGRGFENNPLESKNSSINKQRYKDSSITSSYAKGGTLSEKAVKKNYIRRDRYDKLKKEKDAKIDELKDANKDKVSDLKKDLKDKGADCYDDIKQTKKDIGKTVAKRIDQVEKQKSEECEEDVKRRGNECRQSHDNRDSEVSKEKTESLILGGIGGLLLGMFFIK